MSMLYAREVLKIAISQICDTIGFSSISLTALDILVDVAERQMKCYAKETHNLIETENRIEYPNAVMEDLLPVFVNFNESMDEIQEYMEQFNSLPYAHDILKFPVKSKLFLKIPMKNCSEILERTENEQTEYIYDWLPLFPDQEIQEQEQPALKETIEDGTTASVEVITRKSTKFDSHLSSLKSSHYRPTNVTLAPDGTIVSVKSDKQGVRATSGLPKLLYRPQRLTELDKIRQKEEEKREKERQSQQDENDRRLLLTITSSTNSSDHHEPITTIKLSGSAQKLKKDVKKNGQMSSSTFGESDRSLHIKDVNRKSSTLQQTKSYNTQPTTVDETIDSVIRSMNQQKLSQLPTGAVYDFDTHDVSATDLSEKTVPQGRVPSLLISLKPKSTTEQSTPSETRIKSSTHRHKSNQESREPSKLSIRTTLTSPCFGKQQQSPIISPLIISNSNEIKEKQPSPPVTQKQIEPQTTMTTSEQFISPSSITHDLPVKSNITDIPQQKAIEISTIQQTITATAESILSRDTSVPSINLSPTKEKKKKRHKDKKDRSKKEHKQQNDIQQQQQNVSPSATSQIPTLVPPIPPTSGGTLRVKIKIGKNKNISIVKSTLPELIEDQSFENEEPTDMSQLDTSQSNASILLNESANEPTSLPPSLTVDVATNEQPIVVNDTLEHIKREPLICKIISPRLKTPKFINKTFSPEIIAQPSKHEQQIITVEDNIEKRTSPMPVLEPPIIAVTAVSGSNRRKTKTPNRTSRKKGPPKSVAMINDDIELTNDLAQTAISNSMNEQLHREQAIVRKSPLHSTSTFRNAIPDSTNDQRSRPPSTDDDDLPLIKRHPHVPRSSQSQSTKLSLTNEMLPPASPTIPLHLLSEAERIKRKQLPTKQPPEFIWKPTIPPDIMPPSQSHTTTIRGRGSRGSVIGTRGASIGQRGRRRSSIQHQGPAQAPITMNFSVNQIFPTNSSKKMSTPIKMTEMKIVMPPVSPDKGMKAVKVDDQVIDWHETDSKVWICPGCNRPDNGQEAMIACDLCDDWYHWDCVGITEEPAENTNWYCPKCHSASGVIKRANNKRSKIR